jgi:hypothetical protein
VIRSGKVRSDIKLKFLFLLNLKNHWASHFMNEMAVNKNTSGPSSILRTTVCIPYFIK